MSFILEALKKSELERRAGSMPSLEQASTYMVAVARQPGQGGAALAAGTAMLIAGLVVGGWRPWQPSPPASGKPALAVAQAPVAVAQPLLPAVFQVAAPGSAAPASTAEQQKPPVSMIARPPSKAVAPAAARTAAAPPVPPQAKTVQAAKATPAAVHAAGAAAAPVPAAVAEPRILDYRELPAELRTGLPPVVFGGYASVDEADVRIAFINNRLVKEGEELSPGLKLEQVGREGVVLGYKGYHFRPGS